MTPQDAEVSKALLLLSMHAIRAGQMESAVRLGSRAVARATEAAVPALVGAARVNLGEALRLLGHPDKAVSEGQQAIALLGDDEGNLANAYSNVGLALLDSERWAEALPNLERAEQLKAKWGDRFGEAITKKLQGVALGELGQIDLCLPKFHEAAGMFEALSDLPEARRCFDLAGKYALPPERFLDSILCFREVARLSRELGDHERVAGTLAALGSLIGNRTPDTNGAAALLEEALELVELRGIDLPNLIGCTSKQLIMAVDRYRALTVRTAVCEAFAEGNYAECARLGRKAACLHETTMLLAAIGVARTEDRGAAIDFLRVKGGLAEPWPTALFSLATGRDRDVSQVLPKATTPERRAQLDFYVGVSALAFGERDAALESFRACLSRWTDSPEHGLAAEMLGRMENDRLPLIRLIQLTWRLNEQGDVPRAIRSAVEAIAMADSRFGVPSPEHAQAHESAGKLLALHGSRSRARVHLSTALKGLRDIGCDTDELDALNQALSADVTS